MEKKDKPLPKRGENLYCDEKIRLDETSEFFPEEPIPGVWHVKDNDSLHPGVPVNRFRTDLEPEDVKLLGRLSADQLMEYVRHLQSSAFALGVEESKQFTKAKVLQIFKPKDV